MFVKSVNEQIFSGFSLLVGQGTQSPSYRTELCSVRSIQGKNCQMFVTSIFIQSRSPGEVPFFSLWILLLASQCPFPHIILLKFPSLLALQLTVFQSLHIIISGSRYLLYELLFLNTICISLLRQHAGHLDQHEKYCGLLSGQFSQFPQIEIGEYFSLIITS